MENTAAYLGNHTIEACLYKKYPELESMTRQMVEKLMATTVQGFDEWVTTNPKERYLELMKVRPELLQRVPQYQLASYIGIKPQSLSRLKKRLVKK